eukprot:TRINITY_DN119_c0_g2_i2.p1 TRINITY_DN119_c0_g2~~TRINITY_DN119_c0_g2_i2.p1  ORF type:complete len:1202 (-),score=363.18 TRINITY_DN119_c0_g2_i2:104-3595(-)
MKYGGGNPPRYPRRTGAAKHYRAVIDDSRDDLLHREQPSTENLCLDRKSSYFCKSQKTMRDLVHSKHVVLKTRSGTQNQLPTLQPRATSAKTMLASQLATAGASIMVTGGGLSSQQPQGPPLQLQQPLRSESPKPTPRRPTITTEDTGVNLVSILDFIRAISVEYPDIPTAKHHLCAEICKLCNAQRAYIFDVHKSQNVMLLQTKDSESAEFEVAHYPLSKGIAGKVATTEVLANISQAITHSDFDSQVDDRRGHKTQTLLSVPLHSPENGLVGVLQVVNKHSEQTHNACFTKQDETLLLLLVPHITCALRISQSIFARNALLEAGHTISSELQLPHLYWAVCGKAAQLVSCEAVSLFLPDTQTGGLYLVPAEKGFDMCLFPPGKSIAAHVSSTGEVINVSNMQNCPLYNAAIDKPRSAGYVNNLLCVPLLNRDQSVAGALLVVNKTGCFTDDDVSLLQAFSTQVCEAIQNASVFTKTLDSYMASRSTQKKFQALLEVAESLTMHLDSSGLIQSILQRARELVDAERSSLFLIDAASGELISHVAEGAQQIRFPLNQGIAGYVAKTGEVLNISDAYKDSRFNEEVDKRTGFRTRNIVCVPIRNTSDEIIGVTQIINKRHGEFTKEDEELLKAFSIFCGMCLHNSNLYQQALDSQRRSQALLDIVMVLSSDNQISRLISTIMKKARELIQADRASLFVLDPKNKELRTQLADGADEIIVPTSSSIVGYVASTGEEVNIEDAYSDPRFNAGIDKATGYRTHSVLAIPVLDEHGEVVAVTEMINKRGTDVFKDEDRDLLKAFAAFCGKSLASVAANYSSTKSIHKQQYPLLVPTEDDVLCVRSFDFDVHKFDTHEAPIRNVVAMFDSFDLFTEFRIPMPNFLCFLHELARSYNVVPYHNFYHAVDVTQFLYAMLINSPELRVLPKIEIFAILMAGLCHDVDHGGLNNTFQVNAQTPLALLFSDTSIMETYHCSRSIAILSSESNDILLGLTDKQRHIFWTLMINTILSTDMAVHFSVLEEFEAALKKRATVATVSHKLLSKVLIKCADISNVCRPFPLAKKWADILLNEFFRQGDMERMRGLPLSPFMDREHVVIAQMQLGFANSIAFPMFNLLSQFLPSLRGETLDVLVGNIHEWAAVLSSGEAKDAHNRVKDAEHQMVVAHGKV